MGIQIKLPNANFKKYIDMVSYPLNDNLKGLFYLGKSSASSIINHADDSRAVAHGTIEYSPDYATFDGAFDADYIQTGLPDASENFTVISLIRQSSGEPRSILSSFRSNRGFDATNVATTLYDNTGALRNIPTGLGTTNTATFMLTATVVNGLNAKSYKSAGDRVIAADERQLIGNKSLGVNDLRIGGAHMNLTNNGSLDIAFLAYHDKALTLTELGIVYDYIKTRYKETELPM